jgi:hypothetical protein
MSQLNSWDTSLLIVVVREECARSTSEFLHESLPPNVASLVALAEEFPRGRLDGEENISSFSRSLE